MSFQLRSTDELIRILLAGGGLSLDASMRSTDDLIRMALATKHSGAILTLANLHRRPTDELIRIGLASGGRVVFV